MQIGKILRHRYQINSFLGSGGFGDTYLAEDLDLPGHPQCVVKHLQPKNSAPLLLQAARVLFDREARVLYDLGNAHDQIPRLFAHIEENDQFYLVQEFVEGHPLSEELIVGQAWSEANVVKLLREILEVLSVVHQHGVIHRDIKPQNLMRRQQDQKIVLIDFGAVKEINALAIDTEGHTTSTIAIGTAGYMPPEQAHGHPQLSSDVYAVGVLGIQALLGRMPQQDSKTGDLVWKEAGVVSSQLARVLDKMTCYHFRDRYASAQIASSALVETVIHLNPRPSVKAPELKELEKTVVRSRSNPPLEVVSQEALAKTVVDLRQKPKPPQGKPRLFGLLAFAITGCTAFVLILAFMFSSINSQNQISTSELDQETKAVNDQQNFADQIKKYDEEIKLNPQDASAYYNRGLAKYQLGENQKAIQDYDEAIRLNPQYTNAYYNRGIAQYNLENYQEAIKDYNEAILLDPKDSSAYYNRGLAQYNLENYQAAIKDYDEAIRIKSEYANAYYNRGIAKYSIGDYQGAIKDYDEAILLSPKDVEAYVARGNARVEVGDRQGALKDYRQSADLYQSLGQTENHQKMIETIQKLEG